MENKDVIVSVWMTTYNHEKYISEAIECVLNQKTNFKYELMIGEDCSTDDTRKICLKYQKLHPERIKLILHEKNVGLISNYCETLKHCTGKYIAQLDGDDYWIDPYKLQKQVEFLNNNIDCAMVFTDKYAQADDVIYKENVKLYSNISFKSILLSNMICSPTVLIRRKIINSYFYENAKIAIYRKWLTLDYPLWLEVSFNHKIGYIPEITSIYRVVSGSGSHGENKMKSYLWDKNIVDMQSFYFKKYITSNRHSETLFIKQFNEMIFHARKRMLLDYGWVAREQLGYLLTFQPLFYFYLISSKVRRMLN